MAGAFTHNDASSEMVTKIEEVPIQATMNP